MSSLVFKNSNANSIPTPFLGKTTLFVDENGQLTIKDDNGNTEVIATGNLGSNTQVLFNDDGNIVGNANLTFNKSTQVLTVGGNVSATYFIGNGSQLTGIDATAIQNGTSNVRTFLDSNVAISAAGNANIVVVTGTGANIAGTANVTGNVSANYFIGNGSQLTGIDATTIQNGTSNVRTFLNGNVAISAAGNANIVVVTGTGANVAGTLGVTGNITGGNLIGPLANGNSNVNIPTSNGNVNITAVGNTTAVITGTGVNVTGTLSATGQLLSGSSATANGAFVANAANRWFGIYNATTTIYYGISGALPAPAGTSTLGGYYAGLGIGGSSNGANSPIFGVLTSTQSGNGIGATAFTIYDTNRVVTRNNVLDDGSGNANVGNIGATTGVFTSNVSAANLNGTNANITSNLTAATANITGNLTAANITTGSGSGGNISGANVITANTFIGNLANGNSDVSIPAANGNINFDVAGNANVVVMTGTGVNVSGTLNATGNANVGNIGATTAIITTGNITTVNSGLVQNGNSNVTITANGNVSVFVTGNATARAVFTSTGANIAGTANITGNANVGNLGAAQVLASANITAPQLISNVADGTAPLVVTSTTVVANLRAATANAATNAAAVQTNASTATTVYPTFVTASTNANYALNTVSGISANLSNNSITATTFVGALSGAATTAGTVTTNAQPNITSVGTLTSLGVNGTITGVNITANTGVFTGNGSGLSAIAGANVTGTVSSATTAGTVTTNAQPNITSVGTLSSLTVTGNISGGNLNTAGKVVASTLESNVATGTAPFVVASTTRVANLNVDYANVSDYSNLQNNTSSQLFQLVFAVSSGNAQLKTTDNFSINPANTYFGATSLGGTLTTAAQPNITSVGTLTSLSVTGNVTAGNVSGGNLVSANYLTGTLTTAAQPNITSVGNLTSLDVTGNIAANNLTTTNKVTAGNGLQVSSGTLTVTNGNLDVTGNINVTGNLNYSNVTDLVVGDPLIYIGANNTGDSYDLGIVASYNDGVYEHTGLARNATTDVWTFFDGVVAEPTTVIDWANATYPTVKMGNLNTTGNANITGIANVTGNVVAGNVYANSGTIGASLLAGTLTTASQPNVTSVGTLGSLAVTGNTTSGNFVGVLANGNSNVNIPAANGNVNISASGNANILVATGTGIVVGGNITPNANITYDLGTNTNRFKDLYLANSTIYLGSQTISANATSISMSGNLAANVSGNITGSLANGNSSVNIPAANGNVNISAVGNTTMVITGTGANITGTANITGNATINGTNVGIGNITLNTTAGTGVVFNSEPQVGTWVYANKSFSVAAQETGPDGLYFKPDGTAMYVTGFTGDDINQYSLGTAWDISTASFVQASANIGDNSPAGLWFKPDGTKAYVCTQATVSVREFNLSTAWDVSTLSFVQAYTITEDVWPDGIVFSPDGLTMMILGDNTDSIYQYTLGTAWNVSTASYSGKSLNIVNTNGGFISTAQSNWGMYIDSSGTSVYLINASTEAVVQYTLSTPWDISTGTFTGFRSIYIRELNGTGIWVEDSQDKAYIVGTNSDTIYQYTTGTPGLVTSNPANVTSVLGELQVAGAMIGTQYLYTSGFIATGSSLNGASASISGNISAANITTTGYSVVSVSTGISAAGTVQSNATALTREFNVVSTVASGAGVRLPTAVAGMRITVINTSANALLVYPASTGIINSQAANAAYSQPAGARLDYISTTTTQWYTLNATYG